MDWSPYVLLDRIPVFVVGALPGSGTMYASISAINSVPYADLLPESH